MIEIENFNHPVFCFRYLQKGYDLATCTEAECAALARRIAKLSQMTWREIQFADRHGLGSEKIKLNLVRAGLPPVVTEEVTDLIALRFDGMKPMVGMRNRFIFHLFYIDRDFTLYAH